MCVLELCCDVSVCAGAVLLNGVTHGKNTICPSILIHPSYLCLANVKAQVLKSMVAQHIHVLFGVELFSFWIRYTRVYCLLSVT